jgi:hypothetical protein
MDMIDEQVFVNVEVVSLHESDKLSTINFIHLAFLEQKIDYINADNNILSSELIACDSKTE